MGVESVVSVKNSSTPDRRETMDGFMTVIHMVVDFQESSITQLTIVTCVLRVLTVLTLLKHMVDI